MNDFITWIKKLIETNPSEPPTDVWLRISDELDLAESWQVIDEQLDIENVWTKVSNRLRTYEQLLWFERFNYAVTAVLVLLLLSVPVYDSFNQNNRIMANATDYSESVAKEVNHDNKYASQDMQQAGTITKIPQQIPKANKKKTLTEEQGKQSISEDDVTESKSNVSKGANKSTINIIAVNKAKEEEREVNASNKLENFRIAFVGGKQGKHSAYRSSRTNLFKEHFVEENPKALVRQSAFQTKKKYIADLYEQDTDVLKSQSRNLFFLQSIIPGPLQVPYELMEPTAVALEDVVVPNSTEEEDQSSPKWLYAGVGGNLKASWLLNTKTFNAFEKTSLTTAVPLTTKDLFFVIGSTVSDRIAMHSELYLCDQIGQQYKEYYEGDYIKTTTKLSYRSIKVYMKYRGRMLEGGDRPAFGNWLVGGYIGMVGSAKESSDFFTHDIKQEYKPHRYGVSLGYEYDKFVTSKLIFSSGIRTDLDLNNIYKGDSKAIAYFKRTKAGSVYFSVSLKYLLKEF